MSSVLTLFAQFFAPVTEAVDDLSAMEALLGDLGVDVPLTAAHEEALAAILPVRDLLRDLTETAESPPSDLGEAFWIAQAATAFDAIAGLATLTDGDVAALPGVLGDRATWQRIARELPGYLLLTWLDDVYPVVTAFLALGGAIEVIPRGPGKPVRRRLDWAATGALLRDPPAQIAGTWSFGGTAFDANGFLVALSALFQAMGLRARLMNTPAIATAALGDRAPAAAMRALDGQLLSGTVLDGTTSGLLSLMMTGAARPGGDTPAGLAVLPVLSGQFSLPPIDLGNDVSLSLSASGEAAGGAGLAIYPDGPEPILGQGAAEAGAAATLAGAPGAGTAEPGWIVIGARAASHLRLDRFAFTMSVDSQPADLSVTLDLVEAIALRIAAGPDSDGLINTVLGDTEVEVFGGVSATWSSRHGWDFTGGLGLEVQVPIGADIGPFTVDSVTLAGWAGTEGFGTSAAITGSMTLGPIWLFFDEIGVIVDLVPMPEGQQGNFGALEVTPRFKPPEGYGASLDFDPVTGGGLVMKDGTQYRGALALSFQKFGLSAFAILDTEMPGGDPGFSFAASVFAEFNVPLAFGFFLTGCGGMMGINRTVDTDAMRGVLFDGRLDDLLFPADPIEDAPQILADMASIMPAQPGQHFFGPVVRISWGQPALVHITLGVVIEVGAQVRIIILGSVKMALPDEDHAIVLFQLSFFGVIDFAEGRIDFDASLQGSKVLIFTITGDAAVRTGWGPGIFQIASLGGLHPKYPKPDNLPDLRRLSAGFGSPGDDVRLTIAGYFAQTLNSVQFGASAELYARGPKVPLLGRVSAEGQIGFDALIYFNPFAFTVDVYGGISLMVDGKVKAALYFAITMRGPNPFFISGEVWVKVCGIKVRFAVTHTFGQARAAPTATASAVAELTRALAAAGALEAAAPSPGTGGQITFRQVEEMLIEPLGQLRITQSAVPLGVTLEKLGEARLTGGKRLTLAMRGPGGNRLPAADLPGDFVRAHFFETGRAERLRAPAFESHDAGLEVTDTGFAIIGASVFEEYEYEVIMVGERPSGRPPLIEGLDKVQFQRFAGKFAEGRLHPGGMARREVTQADRVTTRADHFLGHKAADVIGRQSAGSGADLSAILRSADRAARRTLSAFSADDIAVEPEINSGVVDYLSAA
ncbi:hypothetical protein SAMN05421759_1104 [Roseivivax lentus]|uniref:DUF6603 domain-containing protein n=1 Tax=Roseivivax lentus TaxID=633194 RepID=A0A1N7NRR8_9RHOB|nr:DUF6603 domain-containing protein [Roseivivax lentus]SIT01073.1 hypothetical protein SAMN05421759_1104 [Roseivivax lentus]